MPKTGIRPYETKTRGRQWMAYYRRDGRQVNKRGFRTARAAERWRADAMINAASPADSRITVGEWVTEWLGRHGGNIRNSTYQRYEQVIRVWVLPSIGTFRVVRLTHRHIEAIHRSAVQAGRSARTVRQIHAPLRIALEDAVRDGIIPKNPAALVRLPPLEPVEIKPFTADDADRFLRANEEHRYYPIFHLALHSGLRLGEILALRVGRDIDTFGRAVSVRETRRQGQTGPPKSKESLRRVMLDEEATAVLAGATMRKQWGELAFPPSQYSVSQSMAGACDVAGLQRRRFHDLRHTHATLMIRSGANPRAVSNRLGHASVAFTLQTYSHVLPGMDEELAEVAGRMFRQSTLS